jgi:hypothetical protein
MNADRRRADRSNKVIETIKFTVRICEISNAFCRQQRSFFDKGAKLLILEKNVTKYTKYIQFKQK